MGMVVRWSVGQRGASRVRGRVAVGKIGESVLQYYGCASGSAKSLNYEPFSGHAARCLWKSKVKLAVRWAPVQVHQENLGSDFMQLCTTDALRTLTVSSMRFQAISCASVKCPVNGRAVSCSVQLNKLVLVPSKSVVRIRCTQGKPVRKKTFEPDSTSSDELGTDCQHQKHFEALAWNSYRSNSVEVDSAFP